MPERKFVPIKLPLYISEPRQLEVDGNLRSVQSFVEQWRLFDVLSQTFQFPKVYLGLRIEDELDITSERDRADPIRLYRALQFLNRFDSLPVNPDDKIPLTARLHSDLAVAYNAAGHSHPLSHYHYVTSIIKTLIGDEDFQEVRQMIPENLMAVIENLRGQRVAIDGETLTREVGRGHLETNPLYDKIISETIKHRQQDKKVRKRFLTP